MDPDKLTLRTDYWEDRNAKAAFCDLLVQVFGLDLARWDAAGYWDRDFRPFTLFDADGRAVASACLYSQHLVVDGGSVTAGQVSSVATREDWRMRGLARRVVTEALAWSEQAGHSFQYLFADDAALHLYRSLGFEPREERVHYVDVGGRAPVSGARCLDPEDEGDRAAIFRLACARTPASRRLGALGERLLMFHVIGPLRKAVWHIEPLGVLVLAHREGGVLTLLDVVGPRVPTLAELYPFLAAPGDRRVVVRFEPDALGDLAAIGSAGTEVLRGNNLHLRGAFPLVGPVVFPRTAQA